MNVVKVAVAALLVLVSASVAGVGLPEPAGGAAPQARDGITVTGNGEVRSIPNRATLTFGIHTRGATSAAALAANSTAMRRLIAALKQAGVDAKDLQSDYLDVSPRDEHAGYSASSALSLSNQPLERASRLTEIATTHGADTVSGPSLSVADRDAAYGRALERAFGDARAKADALASAAGVARGEVVAIVEGSEPQFPVYAAATRAADGKTPIAPGSEAITAVVTVTFELRG